ncbi:hypothetical protein FPQ18DRAFT_303969 [Pyronema domesticum]|nr:hypothetical protein FPQ18DRAFT_303969 [Pyronema domesticum]
MGLFDRRGDGSPSGKGSSHQKPFERKPSGKTPSGESGASNLLPSPPPHSETRSPPILSAPSKVKSSEDGYDKLGKVLNEIPNLGGEAPAILGLWKTFDTQTALERLGMANRFIRKIPHVGSTRTGYPYEEMEKMELRFLKRILTAVGLGEIRSLAFRVHHTLHVCKSQKKEIEKSKKKLFLILPTFMPMNAIIGPSEPVEKESQSVI